MPAMSQKPSTPQTPQTPTIRMAAKRTIHSPVTFAKLLPLQTVHGNTPKRRQTGIKKAGCPVLTRSSCYEVVKDNDVKKREKRIKKSKLAEQIKDLQKENAAKERIAKKQNKEVNVKVVSKVVARGQRSKQAMAQKMVQKKAKAKKGKKK